MLDGSGGAGWAGMAVFRIMVLLGLLLCCLGAEEPPAPLPVLPQMVLRDGTVLKGVRLINAAGTSTVLARWDGGRGTIALADFSPQMRAQLMARWPQLGRQPEVKAAPKPPDPVVVVLPEPRPEGTVIGGTIYLGAEDAEERRALLARATLKAYPLKDYIAARQAGAQVPMPEPYSVGTSDEQGRWSLTVPPGAEFMVEAEALHQPRGPRAEKIRWTWRIPSIDLEEGKPIELNDQNAAVGTHVSRKAKPQKIKPKKKFLFW